MIGGFCVVCCYPPAESEAAVIPQLPRHRMTIAAFRSSANPRRSPAKAGQGRLRPTGRARRRLRDCRTSPKLGLRRGRRLRPVPSGPRFADDGPSRRCKGQPRVQAYSACECNGSFQFAARRRRGQRCRQLGVFCWGRPSGIPFSLLAAASIAATVIRLLLNERDQTRFERDPLKHSSCQWARRRPHAALLAAATVCGARSCDPRGSKPPVARTDGVAAREEVSSNCLAASRKQRQLGNFCRQNYLLEFSGF